jgi:hypothetical protein
LVVIMSALQVFEAALLRPVIVLTALSALLSRKMGCTGQTDSLGLKSDCLLVTGRT